VEWAASAGCKSLQLPVFPAELGLPDYWDSRYDPLWRAMGMWVLTGVLERFPELKLVFVEPGVGWVAWWLHIADDLAARQGYDFPGLKKAPSEYFRQSVHVTFIDEPDVIRHARDIIGISNVMWSSDYPHPVTSWPRSQAIAAEVTKGVSDAERELILSGNATRVWNL